MIYPYPRDDTKQFPITEICQNVGYYTVKRGKIGGTITDNICRFILVKCTFMVVGTLILYHIA